MYFWSFKYCRRTTCLSTALTIRYQRIRRKQLIKSKEENIFIWSWWIFLYCNVYPQSLSRRLLFLQEFRASSSVRSPLMSPECSTEEFNSPAIIRNKAPFTLNLLEYTSIITKAFSTYRPRRDFRPPPPLLRYLRECSLQSLIFY